MKNRSPWLIVIVGLLFIFGLQKLFVLRFESGDVYPPYSSLRADPVGVKALFESLDHHLEVTRFYRPLQKLGPGRDTTLFHIGSAPLDLAFTHDEYQSLEAFLLDGGRLVFTLHPSYRSPRVNRFLPANRGNNPGSKPNAGPRTAPVTLVTDHWGLSYDYVTLKKDPQGVYAADPAHLQATLNLPESLSCHSSVVFTNLSPEWSVIYARSPDLPVVVERPFGKGRIVLCADSFHLSNEALITERHSLFLTWLTGPATRVVFDETHLGVLESPGIVTLARKYRLEGLGLALAVLAGLFIWKNSSSFMPPYESQSWRHRQLSVAGLDASTGFINLLRRNIPRGQLMRVCLEQWIAHAPRRGTLSSDKLRQMQSLIDEENARPARQQDPVSLYRRFAALLARKNFHSPSTEHRASEPPQPPPPPLAPGSPLEPGIQSQNKPHPHHHSETT